MRELKFRVWQPTNNYVYFGLSKGNSFAFKSTPCIEQYTGLKDKNGKEIYEGDIIKAKVEGVYGVGSSSAYIGSVEWKLEAYWDELRYAFMWHVLGSKTQPDRVYVFYDKRIAELEIIGNIHENPELLEEEK